MARITIYALVNDEDIAVCGDNGLEASLRARLSEVYDNNANPIELCVLGVDVEDGD